MVKIYCTFFIFWISYTATIFEDCKAQTSERLGSEKSKLESVTKKIKKQKNKVKEVKVKEARILSKLDQIEKQLLQQNREHKRLNAKIEKIKAEIKEYNQKIKVLSKDLKAREFFLSRRLTAFYKYQRRGGMRILLSAPSYNQFLRAEKFLTSIIDQDRELFGTSLKTLATAQAYQETLQQKKAKLVAAKQALEPKKAAIKETHQQKLALLKRIKNEKSLQISALKELEDYSKELQSLVDRLQKQTPRISRKKFSSMRGKLAFPVRGKIISSYGKKEHPELHTFTFQKGIEIKSSFESEIRAVFDGTVIFADWFKGYGKMIIIDHGDSYYTLSAHAADLFKKVGDRVKQGEIVGLVGDTSSIKGTCLYFEVRHHGKPQNPLQWLKE